MSDIERAMEGKIGYTPDGLIFFITPAIGPDGNQVQISWVNLTVDLDTVDPSYAGGNGYGQELARVHRDGDR